MEWTTRY